MMKLCLAFLFVGKSELLLDLLLYFFRNLHAVGSFPPQVSALSSSQYEFLVTFLKSIILKKSEVIPLWNRVVEAFAAICRAEERFSDQDLKFGLIDTITSSLFKELSDNDRSLSVQSSLRALSIFCNGRQSMLMSILRKLIGIVCKDLQSVLINGDNGAFQRTFPLLQGILDFILPCCETTNVETEAMLELATDLWNVVENLLDRSCVENLAASTQILHCCLEIVQFSVSRCDESSQRLLLLKMLEPFVNASSHLSAYLRVQDVWIIGFFASTVIALLPSVPIPEEDETLCRLLAAAVSSPCSAVNDVASEAVGCMLNKWHANIDKKPATSGIDSSITEATDLIIKGEWISRALCNERGSSHLPVPEEALLLKVKCIKLLACAGKGLAMRGHIAVSDVAMLLLSLVQYKKSLTGTNPENLLEILWPNKEEKPIVLCAAAEALGSILKDSKFSICKSNHFIIKPLYQQRFFVSMLPPLMLVLKEADATQERVMLYYAFGNLVSGVRASVVLTESKRVFPLVLESLSALSDGERHSDVLLSVLLVLSAILVDRHEIASDHVPAIIGRLLNLINYGYSAMVRETSLLCLGTLVALPYTRVFPFRTQVLRSLTNALDDPRRGVRKEAIRCRRAWDSLSR
ncbi:hypothetical protein L7F22_048752 [Adiantum nelumboides]|nr:hypothetical protein [Adiantum nelumboides]